MSRAQFKISDYPADRPKVPEVAVLVKAYYDKPGNGAGGNLHVVLDDGNLDGVSIAWALQRCLDAGDEEGAAIARKLQQMTPSQPPAHLQKKLIMTIHTRGNK